MNILDCKQGDQDWLSIRAKHNTASEASAMMGASKKTTRNELLRMKATGTEKEFSDWVQKNLIDKGHEIEEAARPLAEAIIGGMLYPVTVSDDAGYLLASLDGLTMEFDVAWECKSWNESKAAEVKDGRVPAEDYWQVVQQLLVTEADRLLYMVTDGTEERCVHVFVTLNKEDGTKLLAGWRQFAEDLKNYTPPEVIPAAVAEPQMALPALAVQVNGEIVVRDNLGVFADALRAYIDGLNMKPETDQDFANLDSAAKLLRETQTKIAAARDSALGQVNMIDAMKRTADMLEELARRTAIELEKLVANEKANRKAKIISSGPVGLSAYIAALNERLGKQYMPTVAADFSGKCKNLRTIESVQNAVDTELARAKIAADEIADRIQINLNWLRENAKGYVFLFADEAQIVLKATDDFAALAKLRIAEHCEAETMRIEAERARIRAEEEARAAAKLKADQEEEFRRQVSAAADRIEKELPAMAQANATAAPAASVPAANEGTGETPAPGQRETPPTEAAVQRPDAVIHIKEDDGRTMRLGEISEALGMTVTADFLAALGFAPVRQEKAAKLYSAYRFPLLCNAIARHVQDVGQAYQMRAAA